MRPLTDAEDFDALVASTPQLAVYITQPGCAVCVSLKPKIEALLHRFGVPGVLVDAKASPAVTGQRMVFTVPTVLIFDEGREVGRFSRHVQMAEVERLLELMA